MTISGSALILQLLAKYTPLTSEQAAALVAALPAAAGTPAITVPGTHIAQVPTGGSATAAANATAINTLLTELQTAGILASS